MSVALWIILILALISLGFVLFACIDEQDGWPLAMWVIVWCLVAIVFNAGISHVVTGGYISPESEAEIRARIIRESLEITP